MQKLNKKEIVDELKQDVKMNEIFQKHHLTDLQIENALLIFLDIKKEIENNNQFTSIYVDSLGHVKRIHLLDKINYNKPVFLKNVLTQYFYSINFDSNKEFYKENERKNIVNLFSKIFNNKIKKGIYLYGPMGVGKSFILKRFARKMAQQNKKIGFISVPSLFSKIKTLFNESEKYVQIIEILKNVEYLFLDDIGLETVTSWFRDEILFEIISYRVQNDYITFFGSNYSLEELEKIEAKNANNKSVDIDKAKRLVSRIKNQTHQVLLLGKNKKYSDV